MYFFNELTKFCDLYAKLYYIECVVCYTCSPENSKLGSVLHTHMPRVHYGVIIIDRVRQRAISCE